MHRLWLISTLLNVLLGGKYPETLSSRCWRNKKHWWFRIWYHFWNHVFCDEAHCVESYLETQRRKKMYEKWEQMFLPLNHPNKLKSLWTQCVHCDAVVLQAEAHKTGEEDYCSYMCYHNSKRRK